MGKNLEGGGDEEEWSVENEEAESVDARLPVTQSDDPLSGGHFDLGTSKPPLQVTVSL